MIANCCIMFYLFIYLSQHIIFQSDGPCFVHRGIVMLYRKMTVFKLLQQICKKKNSSKSYWCIALRLIIFMNCKNISIFLNQNVSRHMQTRTSVTAHFLFCHVCLITSKTNQQCALLHFSFRHVCCSGKMELTGCLIETVTAVYMLITLRVSFNLIVFVFIFISHFDNYLLSNQHHKDEKLQKVTITVLNSQRWNPTYRRVNKKCNIIYNTRICTVTISLLKC